MNYEYQSYNIILDQFNKQSRSFTDIFTKQQKIMNEIISRTKTVQIKTFQNSNETFEPQETTNCTVKQFCK